MWFLTVSSKIYVSAAVFYSTFSLSKCKAGDIPETPWQHDNEIVHIYKTEVPWTPIEFKERKNNAFMAWVAVLSVTISIACIVCLYCICWRLCTKPSPRRQSSNAALMSSAPEAVVVFQTDTSTEADGTTRNSTTTTSNFYGRGVVNFAFTSSLQDPVPGRQTDDVPPDYSTVISEIPPNDRPANTAPFPLVSGTKTVETPPPAYMSVAPFQ